MFSEKYVLGQNLLDRHLRDIFWKRFQNLLDRHLRGNSFLETVSVFWTDPLPPTTLVPPLSQVAF